MIGQRERTHFAQLTCRLSLMSTASSSHIPNSNDDTVSILLDSPTADEDAIHYQNVFLSIAAFDLALVSFSYVKGSEEKSLSFSIERRRKVEAFLPKPAFLKERSF